MLANIAPMTVAGSVGTITPPGITLPENNKKNDPDVFGNFTIKL
jgi:hypothetical protein